MKWLARKLRQLFRNRPQIVDREYIEDETSEEIGHINDTAYPDKAERPLPHIPKSHSPGWKEKPEENDKSRAKKTA